MTPGVRDPQHFILRNKRDVSRLQILVEIIEHQPAVRQQEIGKTLGLTPQAISEYIRDLVERGMVMVNGRGNYEVTHSGVEWMLMNAEALASYSRHIRHDLIHQVATWTAIADANLHAGDEVGILMQDGFLHAAKKPASATGRVIADAQKGLDVGITDLTGIIEHHMGAVHVCKVPRIKFGGSRKVRIDHLRKIVAQAKVVAAVGLESWIALKTAGRKPDLYFGARDGIIEASHFGLNSAIVVVDEEFTDILRRLEGARIPYVFHDLILPADSVSDPGSPPQGDIGSNRKLQAGDR